MKSGFIAIVGRPNTGKSTLLNNLLNTKVAIVSDKPGTTRHSIHGVYHEDDYQIVFVDTPGIHKPKHQLGELLNKTAYQSLNEVDAVLFITDASQTLGKGDQLIIDILKQKNKPMILLLNKIDKITKEEVLLKITEYEALADFAEIIPISGLKKDNTDKIIPVLKKYLTDTIPYYEKEQVTNRSHEFMISEIIREKVLNLTEEEIPHAVTCLVENIKKQKEILIISALIIVDRDSLKKIIIGKKGGMIKKIGTLAREEIELLVNQKVFLELHVKVVKKWREKESYIKEFGYGNN